MTLVALAAAQRTLAIAYDRAARVARWGAHALTWMARGVTGVGRNAPWDGPPPPEVPDDSELKASALREQLAKEAAMKEQRGQLDLQTRPFAITPCRHLFPEVVRIDQDLLMAMRPKLGEGVVQHRHTTHGHQRLGTIIRQRSQPSAKSRCQQKCSVHGSLHCSAIAGVP